MESKCIRQTLQQLHILGPLETGGINPQMVNSLTCMQNDKDFQPPIIVLNNFLPNARFLSLNFALYYYLLEDYCQLQG